MATISQDLYNELKIISKTKENGLYSKKGWKYIVNDNSLKYIGNKYDGIFMTSGVFVVQVWSGKSYEFDTKMKELFKSFN